MTDALCSVVVVDGWLGWVAECSPGNLCTHIYVYVVYKPPHRASCTSEVEDLHQLNVKILLAKCNETGQRVYL